MDPVWYVILGVWGFVMLLLVVLAVVVVVEGYRDRRK